MTVRKGGPKTLVEKARTSGRSKVESYMLLEVVDLDPVIRTQTAPLLDQSKLQEA